MADKIKITNYELRITNYEFGEAGFTLVEMLVIVTLVGVLTAMAFMGFSRFIANSRLNSHRDTLLAYIQEAKARSITSVPHGVVFASNGKGYQFVKLEDTVTSNFEYDSGEAKTVIDAKADGNTITLEGSDTMGWNNCLVDNTLWFDRKGLPRCADWSNGAMTITIASGTVSKEVVIDFAGKVKYE